MEIGFANLDIGYSCLPAGRGIYLEPACQAQAGDLVIGI